MRSCAGIVTNGGGVALYVHKSLDVTIRQDLMDCNVESVSVQIKVGHYRPFLVTSLYRPPGKPVSHFQDIEKTLSAIEADGKEAIIMGDTNCDYLNQSSNDTKHMKKIAHKLGFSHIIKEATRTTADTKTNIDHIFTNMPEFVRVSGVIHCGISDHDAVYMIRNMRVSKPHKLPPKILNVRNFRKFDQVAFQLDIQRIPTEQITFVSKDVNEMWLLWKTFFLDILNKHAPITNIKVKSNHLPYVTSELRGLIRQRDYLRAKANKSGSAILRQAFVQVRQKVNYMIKNLRHDYYEKKIEDNKNNLKVTWKILKQAIGQSTKSTCIDKVIYDCREVVDKQEIADICNLHFISVGKRLAEGLSNTNIDTISHIATPNEKFTFSKISTEQVKQVIRKLVNNKATGVHDIPNRVLKDCVDVIAPFLTGIFNCSLLSKIFPDDLKTGKVAPVFKCGDRDNLNNYRPITVLPTIARVFEKLIYQQLYQFLDKHKILGKQQYGFRSLHSTALALSEATNHWLMNIDNGNMNSVVFLDIRKAFDTIDHQILIKKLSQYGIQDDELNFFESYLENRTQCCSVNGKLSDRQKIEYGVPQGSILGPLLFIIYMNDLPLFVTNAQISMYADDTSLYNNIKSVSEIKDNLIPAFLKICDWLRSNKLSLNTLKTEFMVIGSQNKLNNMDSDPMTTPYLISIDGFTIKRTKIVKYLGLVVHDALTWSQHIDYISTKIAQGVGILKRTRSFLPKQSLLTLYQSMIEPYFRYCNIVWGQCNETLLDRLQTLQNRAARVIANISYESADHNSLLCDYGWLNVRNLIRLDLGVFMYKTQKGLAPDVFYDLYHSVTELHSYNTRSAYNGNLQIPLTNLRAGDKAISVSGARIWNNIPKSVKQAQSLDVFKRELKEYLIKSQQALIQ